MTGLRKARYLVLAVAALGAVIAGSTLQRRERLPIPAVGSRTADARAAEPTPLDDAPAEVREFLVRVLDRVPEAGRGVGAFRFHQWEPEGKPTAAGFGLKAVLGVDPEALIAAVLDVDGYKGKIAHVEACRSRRDPSFVPPRKVRFFQVLSVPGVANLQQEAALVDAGTIKGYRVAYWYLLKEETDALDRNDGARSDFNVGAWLAAPGMVGYALSSYPKKQDVNGNQWRLLTSAADRLAGEVVQGNIDGMAKWAEERPKSTAGPPSSTTGR